MKKTLIVGIAILFGFVAPFLMVLRILESTLLLGFLSYGASFAGLILGIIGAAWYWRIGKS